jgi:hypothetical protein
MVLFKRHHVGLILKKQKTETRRAWKRKMMKEGGIYKAKTQMLSLDYFAKLKAVKVFRQKLGDMTEAEAQAEGGYTLKEYKEEFKRINKFWDDNYVAWVIKFELVEANPNFKM